MKTSERTQAPETSARDPKRLIVLVGGDKGGVGKSTVARALAEYFNRNQTQYIGYDGDDTNPSFLRFFGNAERLNTKTLKGFEPLVNHLEGDERLVQLVDLGAGTSLVLGQFCEQTGLIDFASQFDAQVTFLFVLAPSADSVGLLKILTEQYGDRIRYVIARSEAIPGTWSLWEESKTRNRLLVELAATEISIPALDAETYSMIDRHSLGWSSAAADKRLPLVNRSYVHRWLARVFAEFEKSKSVLMPRT